MSWQSTMIPASGPDGTPILSVLAKRTYDLAPGKATPAAEQPPFVPAEVTLDPSSPLYTETVAEAELVGYKPFTDVVVLGRAFAPRGNKAYRLECEVRVGAITKKMVVYGERKLESKVMRGLAFTDPRPFESREIGYAHAFGGRAKSKDGTLFPYPPNPIGKGFTLKGGFEEYEAIAVPSCEDPDSPIEPDELIVGKYEDWRRCPKPVSFGWTKQGFFPRYTYAGVLPDLLAGAMEAGHPINPQTPRLDFRFFQGASEGMGERLLAGDEPVMLRHMDAGMPRYEFRLPEDRPELAVTIAGTRYELEAAPQTVVIDKENSRLTMIWRGSRAYGGVEELPGLTVGYEVH